MKSFVIDGKEYRSLRQCCDELKLSYSKVRRFCRHYKRAEENPVLAVQWCVSGKVPLNEPKTNMFRHDLEIARDRQREFQDRTKQKIQRYFMESRVGGV